MIASWKKNIHLTCLKEIDYLSDAQLISSETASAILALLPSQPNLTPSAASLQLPNLSALNINDEKQGWYAPATPQPQPQQQRQDYQPPSQAPPAYAQPAPPPTPQQQPQPQPQPQQPHALTHATALYTYTPTDAGDLALSPHDRIAVAEYMNAEWWKGRSERTGQEGIFPRSYVREDTAAFPSERQQQQQSYGGNMPMAVAQGGPQQQGVVYGNGNVAGQPGRQPGKGEEMGKKFGKKLGNAAIFGAGASIGSNIVNSIF